MFKYSKEFDSVVKIKSMYSLDLFAVVESLLSAVYCADSFEEGGRATVSKIMECINPNILRGPWYILYRYARKSLALNGQSPISDITEDILEMILSSKISSFVEDPEVACSDFLADMGISTQMSSDEEVGKARSILYSSTLRVFTEMKKANVSLTSGNLLLEIFRKKLDLETRIKRSEFELLVCTTGIGELQEVEGAEELEKGFLALRHVVFGGFDNGVVRNVYDNLQDISTVNKKYPPKPVLIDLPYSAGNITPIYIRKGDVVTIMGPEGIGKSTVGVDLICRMLVQGLRVGMPSGEIGERLLLAQIKSRLLFEKTGVRLTPEDIASPLESMREDVNSYVRTIDVLMATEFPNLVTLSPLKYEESLDYISKCTALGLDVLIVDPCQAQNTTGKKTWDGQFLSNDKLKVGYMVKTMYQYKLANQGSFIPPAIVFIGHPDVKTLDILKKGVTDPVAQFGTRISGSASELTAYADLAMLMYDPNGQVGGKTLCMYLAKTRFANPSSRVCQIERDNYVPYFKAKPYFTGEQVITV